MPNPTNSEQVEAEDHRSKAIRIIKEVDQGYEDVSLQTAGIYATLALVDEVAKLREAVSVGKAESRAQEAEAALREINEYDVSSEVQKILDFALLGVS